MTDKRYKLLVVDDQPEIRMLLGRYLREQGYDVETVADGTAMERHLARHSVDLIVLDLMLPGEDGLSLARRLRSRGSQPIIMLSARGEEVDRIVGLEVGADDYLAKPFNPRELLARIRAVLRRTQARQTADATESELQFGPYHLDLVRHRLTRDGHEIGLTTSEFELLKVFAQHPDRVLSRDFLLEQTKGYERDPFDRSIDVGVNRLRRKIEPDSTAPTYLRTVRGAGYLFSSGG